MSNPKLKAQSRTNERTPDEPQRQAEAYFRSIVESVPMGMHMYRLETDDRLVFMGANSAAEKILGIDHRQFVGKTIEEAFPALADTEVPERYRRAAATGEAWQSDQVIYDENQIVGAFEVNAFQTSPGEIVAAFLDITERKRTEAELRKLSRAVEQSANTVVITDTKGYIEYVNPKFTNTTGYSREEAVGQHTRVLKSGETSPEEYKGLWETITAGNEWQGEFHNKRKNGELYWEMASISPIKDEQGNVTHFLAVKEDITERKMAEAGLRESEARYATVVEHAIDGIIIIQDNICQFANQALAGILGYAPAEMQGAHFIEFVAPESRAFVAARAKARLAGEAVPPSYELKLLRQDGLVLDAEMSAGIIQYQGKPANLGIIRDITERKQIEEALQASEARYRELVQSANSIILQFDPEGRITFINEFGQQFFGYTEEEILGQSVLDTIVPVTDSAGQDLATMIRDLVQHPERYTKNENENVCRNGERVWVSWANKALVDATGEITGVFCIGQDITARVQAEQARLESERRLADIIDFMPYPTFAIDNEGQVIAWNRASEEALGVKAEKILGKGDYEYALPFYGERRPILIDLVFADPEEIEQNYTTVRREGETLVGEATVYPQGQERYFVGTAAPLYDAQGNIAGAIETFHDITEQKQFEAARQESEQRLADIIDFLPTPTFVIDLEGNVIAWNQAIAEVTGVKPEDILGKGNYEYALPFFGERRPLLIDLIFEPEEEVAKKYTNVRRESNSLLAENRVFPRGIERYYDLSAAGLYDAQGKLVGAIETFRDITEQKQSEAALRESEARYSAVVEQSNDGIIIIQDNLCQFVNQTLADMLGYAPEEIENTPFVNYLAPESRALVVARVKARLAGEDVPPVYEANLLRKDGTTFEAELSAGVIQYRGEVADVGLIRDITERKQAEQALRQTNLVVQNSPVVLFRWRAAADWPVEFVSENIAQFGYTPEELLTGVVPYVSIVHPDDLARVGREVQEYSASGVDQFRQQYRIITADGKVRWTDDRTVIERDTDGKITYYQGIVIDITEQKQLEQQIQVSLARREQEVQLSTDIAQEIATATREEELYGRIVTSVVQQLNCSHAQLYRYRAGSPAARLVAGDGEVGRRMLTEGYQVSVGHGSVGAAIATGSSVLRPDVSKDQAWSATPLLPGTKGELAVPIKVGGEDAEAQARGLDYFINTGFDGLALIAIDPAVVQPIAKNAVSKGLAVVAIHTDLGVGNQTALVQIINREMGYNLGIQAGAWAKEHLATGQTLKLGILNYPLVPAVVEREEGIIEGIKTEFGDNIEIVGREPAGDPGQGLLVAERWLEAYSDLQMILGINDGGALGAYRAVIAADKDYPDTFFVGGIDATDEALAALQQGGVYQATVDIKPKATGALTVRLLVAAIKSKPYPQVSTVQSTPVNRTNLDAFLESRREVTALPDALELDEVLAGLDLSAIKIGLSVLSINNPFFANLAIGAREEAERLGIELVINDPKQVLGVLAVQSDVADSLDAADQLALEGLSAQLATAFESLRLRQEMEDRLHELNALQRLMSHEGWQEYRATHQQAAPGYLFDQMAVRPVERAELGIAATGQAQAEAPAEKAPGHKAVTKPLTVSGESIGTLGIYDDDPDHPLSPEDQAFLDEVAAQVAEALERARLLEQSQSSLAAAEMLYQAGRRVTEARNLQEVVAAVMEVSSISAIKRAVLLALEQDSAGDVESMTVVANWSSGEGTEPTPIGTHLSKAVLAGLNLFRTPEPLFFGDVQHDDRIDPAGRLILQQGNTQALAAVPLWVGSRQVGVLTLEAEEVYEFSDQDMRLILALADQAAVAIENQRLLEETQTALAEVEATQRRYTVQAWEAYRVRRPARSYEEDREGVPPLGEQLPPEVSRVVAEKKPVAITAPPALAAGGDDDEPPAVEAKSSLLVPLTVRDEVIGVLGLQNTAEARNWSPEEITLVEAIAEQVAQAAEQIRLFDETQQRAARERRVGEIGDKIRAAQSLEEALQVAVKEVGLSLKAPQTTVKLEVE